MSHWKPAKRQRMQMRNASSSAERPLLRYEETCASGEPGLGRGRARTWHPSIDIQKALAALSTRRPSRELSCPIRLRSIPFVLEAGIPRLDGSNMDNRAQYRHLQK